MYFFMHMQVINGVLTGIEQFYYLGVNTAMFRIVQAKGSFTNITLLLMFVEGSRMSHMVLY